MSGGEVFDASYRALAPFGRIVAYGIATNEANKVSTGSLLRHSRAVVGFYLFHCLERPAMFADALADLFARAARGELKAIVGQHLPARRGRAGADRPARASHHGQAPARPDRVSKSFADLGLSESTLQALRDVGYESPSPIQEEAIPACSRAAT